MDGVRVGFQEIEFLAALAEVDVIELITVMLTEYLPKNDGHSVFTVDEILANFRNRNITLFADLTQNAGHSLMMSVLVGF